MNGTSADAHLRLYSNASQRPEREVWVACLDVALKDALRPLNKSDIEGSIGWWQQHAADVWVRSKSNDFIEVCELAGFDPEFVHKSYIFGRITYKNLSGKSPLLAKIAKSMAAAT
jgi:hypothetical protein